MQHYPQVRMRLSTIAAISLPHHDIGYRIGSSNTQKQQQWCDDTSLPLFKFHSPLSIEKCLSSSNSSAGILLPLTMT
eukprot:4986841-Ditylum_brightwellii.AAC.1